MIKERIAYLLLTCAASFAPGCVSDHTERAADVDPRGWSPGDTVWVAYENFDTLKKRDISVILRWTAPTTNENVRLAVTTVTPDSLVFSENIEVYLPSASAGRDHCEILMPYRTASVLGRQGRYRFGFSPARRYDGITAVGVKSDQ